MNKIISKGRVSFTRRNPDGSFKGGSFPYEIIQTEPLSIIDLYAELGVRRL